MSTGAEAVWKIPGVPKLQIHGVSQYGRTNSFSTSSHGAFSAKESNTGADLYFSGLNKLIHVPKSSRTMNKSPERTSTNTHAKNPVVDNSMIFSYSDSANAPQISIRQQQQSSSRVGGNDHLSTMPNSISQHGTEDKKGTSGRSRFVESRESTGFKNHGIRSLEDFYTNASQDSNNVSQYKAQDSLRYNNYPEERGNGDSDALRKFLLEQRKVRCKLAELSKAEVVSEDGSSMEYDQKVNTNESQYHSQPDPHNMSNNVNVVDSNPSERQGMLVPNLRIPSNPILPRFSPILSNQPENHGSIEMPEVCPSDECSSLTRTICRVSQSPPIAILESLSGHDESLTEYEESSDPTSDTGSRPLYKYSTPFSRVIGQRRDRVVFHGTEAPNKGSVSNIAPVSVDTSSPNSRSVSKLLHGNEEPSIINNQGENVLECASARSRWISRNTPQNDIEIKRAYSLMKRDSKSIFRVNPLAVLGRCDSFNKVNKFSSMPDPQPNPHMHQPPPLQIDPGHAPEQDLIHFNSASPHVPLEGPREGCERRSLVPRENPISHPATAAQNGVSRTTINRRYTHTGAMQPPARPLNRQVPNLNSISNSKANNDQHSHLVRSVVSGSAAMALADNTDSEIDTLKNIVSPGASSTQRSIRSSFVGENTDCNGLSGFVISANLQRELLNTGIPLKTIINQFEIGFALVSPPGEAAGYITVPSATPAELARKGFNLHRINSGTFCSVYKARYRQFDVAVKCPDEHLLKSDSEMMRCRALQEWRILSRTSHQNILNFHGGVIVKDQIWLVTDYIRGGDLYTLLYHRPPELLRPTTRLNLMEQLCSALAYLHMLKPKIAHKDIKCNNLLVGEDMRLRVCDFGDAEEMNGPFLQRCTAATWQYTPPELIGTEDPSRPKGSNEQVDVWAMGCVFLEILKCPTPFVHILDRVAEDRQRNVLRQCYLENRLESECKIPSSLPQELKGVISLCLCFNPKKRPLSTEILNFISQKREELLYEITEWQSRWEKRDFKHNSRHNRQFSQESTYPSGSVTGEMTTVKQQPHLQHILPPQAPNLPILANSAARRDSHHDLRDYDHSFMPARDSNARHVLSARGFREADHRAINIAATKMQRDHSNISFGSLHKNVPVDNYQSVEVPQPMNVDEMLPSTESKASAYGPTLNRSGKNQFKDLPQTASAWERTDFRRTPTNYRMLSGNLTQETDCVIPSIATIAKTPSGMHKSWDRRPNGRLPSNGFLITEKRSPRPAVRDHYSESRRPSKIELDSSQGMVDRRVFANNLLRSSGPALAVSRNITDTGELKRTYLSSGRGLRGESPVRERSSGLNSRGLAQLHAVQREQKDFGGANLRKAPLMEAIYGNVINGRDAFFGNLNYSTVDSHKRASSSKEKSFLNGSKLNAGRITNQRPVPIVSQRWMGNIADDISLRSREAEDRRSYCNVLANENNVGGDKRSELMEGVSTQTGGRIAQQRWGHAKCVVDAGSYAENQTELENLHFKAANGPVYNKDGHVLSGTSSNPRAVSANYAENRTMGELQTMVDGKRDFSNEYIQPESKQSFREYQLPLQSGADNRAIISSRSGIQMPLRQPRFTTKRNGLDWGATQRDRSVTPPNHYGITTEKDTDAHWSSGMHQHLVSPNSLLGKKELLQSLLFQQNSSVSAGQESIDTKPHVRLSTRSRPHPHLDQQLSALDEKEKTGCIRIVEDMPSFESTGSNHNNRHHLYASPRVLENYYV